MCWCRPNVRTPCCGSDECHRVASNRQAPHATSPVTRDNCPLCLPPTRGANIGVAPLICTCIAQSTINSYCPVHMPAPKGTPFNTTGAGVPQYDACVVTLQACSRCGAMHSGYCVFCGERDERQAAICDVAKRAREDERVKAEQEIAESIESFPTVVPMQQLPAALANWVREGRYRRAAP